MIDARIIGETELLAKLGQLIPDLRSALEQRIGRLCLKLSSKVQDRLPRSKPGQEASARLRCMLSGEGSEQGKLISIDENDCPILTDVPEPTTEELAAATRSKRGQLLAACDWTQVTDAPVDQAAWRVYRQALRDITTQAGFPASVDWPVAPQ